MDVGGACNAGYGAPLSYYHGLEKSLVTNIVSNVEFGTRERNADGQFASSQQSWSGKVIKHIPYSTHFKICIFAPRLRWCSLVQFVSLPAKTGSLFDLLHLWKETKTNHPGLER